MARARVDVGARRPIHLERCASCHGVWFDGGEWQLLANAHLLERLDEFWTEEWRTTQRKQTDRAQYEQRVRNLFGDDLYAEISNVATALRGHPRRSQALAIIRDESES